MILDTCALIELEKGNPGLLSAARKVSVLTLSRVAIAEFRCGIPQAKAHAKARAFIDQLEPLCNLLNLTDATVRHYADIWNELRIAGIPIPTNDIWIAASAREHQLPVLTRDRHFEKIKGLKVVGW
jgi:predicted nucleic acid-binding protein